MHKAAEVHNTTLISLISYWFPKRWLFLFRRINVLYGRSWPRRAQKGGKWIEQEKRKSLAVQNTIELVVVLGIRTGTSWFILLRLVYTWYLTQTQYTPQPITKANWKYCVKWKWNVHIWNRPRLGDRYNRLYTGTLGAPTGRCRLALISVLISEAWDLKLYWPGWSLVHQQTGNYWAN